MISHTNAQSDARSSALFRRDFPRMQVICMGGMSQNREKLRQSVLDYLRDAAGKAGLDLTNLARKAGLAPSTLNKFASGKVSHIPSLPTLSAISRASGLPLPATVLNPSSLENDKTPPHSGAVAARPVRTRSANEGPPAVPAPPFGARDLPVLGRAQGGLGVVKIAADESPIDWTNRPADLVGVADAYALYMPDEALAPMYDPGDLVYVHPGWPVRPGRAVVVQKNDGTALVRILVAQTDKEIRLKQLEPARTFGVPLAEVRALHRVMGRIESR